MSDLLVQVVFLTYFFGGKIYRKKLFNYGTVVFDSQYIEKLTLQCFFYSKKVKNRSLLGCGSLSRKVFTQGRESLNQSLSVCVIWRSFTADCESDVFGLTGSSRILDVDFERERSRLLRSSVNIASR